MKVYFDEAGNSGQNLLDNNQPIFAIASINFTIEETRDILSSIKSDGDELHFNRLRKYSKYHSQILECLNHDLITSDRVKIVYYDKKFALVGHIVDQLIETVLHHLGIDLYKKGLNLTFANSIYFFGLNEWNQELFENFLRSFQEMIRNKTAESITSFYQNTHILNEFIDEKQQQILQPILLSSKHITEILDSVEKYTIDLTLPSVTLLADIWNKETNENLDIIHDDSKQIEFWKDFIHFVSKSIGEEKVEVGFDYRKMTYPLAIDSVSLESSKEILQIQLADLLASSLAYCIKKIHIEKSDDNLAKQIMNSKIGHINTYPIMPSNKLTPKDLGTEDDTGINPLDHLARKMYEAENKLN